MVMMMCFWLTPRVVVNLQCVEKYSFSRRTKWNHKVTQFGWVGVGNAFSFYIKHFMNLGVRVLGPREFLLEWSVKIMYRESWEARITKDLGITYNHGGLSGLNWKPCSLTWGRGQLKCDSTRAETRFRLSAKRTSPFKSAVGVSSVDYWHPRFAHQR